MKHLVKKENKEKLRGAWVCFVALVSLMAWAGLASATPVIIDIDQQSQGALTLDGFSFDPQTGLTVGATTVTNAKSVTGIIRDGSTPVPGLTVILHLKTDDPVSMIARYAHTDGSGGLRVWCCEQPARHCR